MKRADELTSQDALTLAAIFAPKTPPVPWLHVIALLRALGFVLKNGRGSRRKFINEDEGLVYMTHAPHPGNELGKGAVRQLRTFLKNIGVTP